MKVANLIESTNLIQKDTGFAGKDMGDFWNMLLSVVGNSAQAISDKPKLNIQKSDDKTICMAMSESAVPTMTIQNMMPIRLSINQSTVSPSEKKLDFSDLSPPTFRSQIPAEVKGLLQKLNDQVAQLQENDRHLYLADTPNNCLKTEPPANVTAKGYTKGLTAFNVPAADTLPPDGTFIPDSSMMTEIKLTEMHTNQSLKPVADTVTSGKTFIPDKSMMSEIKLTVMQSNQSSKPVPDTATSGKTFIPDKSTMSEITLTEMHSNQASKPVADTVTSGKTFIPDKSIIPEIKLTEMHFNQASKPVPDTVPPGRIYIPDKSTMPEIKLTELQSNQASKTVADTVPPDRTYIPDKSTMPEIKLTEMHSNQSTKSIADTVPSGKTFVPDKSTMPEIAEIKVTRNLTQSKQFSDFTKMDVAHSSNLPPKQADSSDKVKTFYVPQGSEVPLQFHRLLHVTDNPADPKGKINEIPIQNKIADQLVAASKEGKREISITLAPERLGKITLQVISDKDGISTKIITDNWHVKNEISTQSLSLADTLKEKGYRLNHIEVHYKGNGGGWNDFSGNRQHSQQQYEQKNQNHRPRNPENSLQMVSSYLDRSEFEQDQGNNYFV